MLLIFVVGIENKISWDEVIKLALSIFLSDDAR